MICSFHIDFVFTQSSRLLLYTQSIKLLKSDKNMSHTKENCERAAGQLQAVQPVFMALSVHISTLYHFSMPKIQPQNLMVPEQEDQVHQLQARIVTLCISTRRILCNQPQRLAGRPLNHQLYIDQKDLGGGGQQQISNSGNTSDPIRQHKLQWTQAHSNWQN